MRRLIIGTRASPLALRQTAIVEAALRDALPAVEVETRTIRTEGDRRTEVSLEALGGQGVFVKDIERGLIAREIDLAVHSLKDVPAQLPAGLTIGAVLERGDVRDALVGHGQAALAALPEGAIVGTDSRRRAVQLRALRPDLRTTSVRGNVETRVRKAETGELDAVVLAAAGLDRLGLLDRASQIFSADELLPAVGQGAIGVEVRADDAELLDLLSRVDHEATRVAVTAERAFLRRLGAGCRLPVAAFGSVVAGRLRLRGLLANGDAQVQRDQLEGETSRAEAIGVALAERLLTAAGVEAVE